MKISSLRSVLALVSLAISGGSAAGAPSAPVARGGQRYGRIVNGSWSLQPAPRNHGGNTDYGPFNKATENARRARQIAAGKLTVS